MYGLKDIAQDIGKHYTNLDYSARMNVNVDHLVATNYLTSGHGKPMRSLPHIDASLTINDGRRYPGNLETNLRWHINGSYLKLYLQKQKGWSEQVWKTIDLHNFGSHFQSLCPSQQVHQSKLVYNLLPLGFHKEKISAVASTKLRLCPCCCTSSEDTFHLLQCLSNPGRSEAMDIFHKANTLQSLCCTME